MTVLKSLAALTALVAAVTSAPLEARQVTTAPYLHSSAVAKGKLWFGTASDIPGAETSDTAYMTVLNNTQIFGQLTPANSMKWQSVEPTQNGFTFSGGQQLINVAQASGKKVRCHNLVWYQQLPNWVTSGTWTNATLLAAMQNHITKTIQNYGSSCYSWDVVNEALNDDGTLRSNVFTQYIGPAYVPLAFRYAQAAVKATGAPIKLVYNDYNIESPGAKATAAVNLVKQIKAYGAQIDGVGFESHFIVGETPSTSSQMSAMSSFTALGLSVFQTEIDVRFQTLPPSTAQLAQQATDYYSTVSACMKTAGCQGITVWDFDDKYSWIPSTFSGQGEACLYNTDLTRKPAYTAVYQAIEGTACTVC